MASVNFTQGLAYNVRTGNCPVCRKRKSKVRRSGSVGITCGHPFCMKTWLPGGRHIHEKEVVIEKEEHESD